MTLDAGDSSGVSLPTEIVMARAALFVLIATAAGLAIYLLFAPRFVHSGSDRNAATSNQSNTTTPPSGQPPDFSNSSQQGDLNKSGAGSNSPGSESGIDVPRTGEQRAHDDLEARRAPLYEWIRANMRSYLVGWQPSAADPATLDLYLARSAAADVSVCMDKLVSPYATHYGFSHVHFYVPNTANEAEHWRVDSEAFPDTDGSWHEYRK